MIFKVLIQASSIYIILQCDLHVLFLVILLKHEDDTWVEPIYLRLPGHLLFHVVKCWINLVQHIPWILVCVCVCGLALAHIWVCQISIIEGYSLLGCLAYSVPHKALLNALLATWLSCLLHVIVFFLLFYIVLYFGGLLRFCKILFFFLNLRANLQWRIKQLWRV